MAVGSGGAPQGHVPSAPLRPPGPTHSQKVRSLGWLRSVAPLRLAGDSPSPA